MARRPVEAPAGLGSSERSSSLSFAWPRRTVTGVMTGLRERCCVRTTGKEDDRENELKPFVAVQRVRLPRGKGQPASRKQALHVCGNVTREAYGSWCRSCVLAPKSAIAEAFAVNAAGAAST